MLSYESAATMPLSTDALIQERAAEIVGRAVGRQLWLFFLGDDDVQLPLVVPVDNLPVFPPEHAMAGIADFAESVGAASIVAVLERYGDDVLTPADRAWAKHVRTSCVDSGVRLRAILLSHRRGIRWIAEDDYLY